MGAKEGSDEKVSEKLNVDGLGDAPKPQRKLSTRSKSDDAKKDPSSADSPKKEKNSPKKEGKNDSPKSSPKKSPKKGVPDQKELGEDSAHKFNFLSFVVFVSICGKNENDYGQITLV